jgi:FemAB-related protein (PEP-CTERM system-associated)
MNLSDSPAIAVPVSIRPAAAADESAWRDYVANCPQATFFHRYEWRSIIESVFRHRTHHLLAEQGGRIVGVLPLAEVRSRLFGHSLASLPFAAYGGAAADSPQIGSLLIDEAAGLATQLGVSHLELRNLAPAKPEWPRQDLYVTYRKQLLSDVEANMLAIPRKQRAMVRKSIQRGLAAEIDPDVSRFFDVYADNVHRHGTPGFSRRYFETLREVFGADCEVLTVLGPDRQPVSSVLSFYWRDEVLPYYAGDMPAARELAANDFKYWELMRRSVERGIKVFDYGRSKRGSGSFDFKKNWGFEATPLAYEYKLLKRDSIPQNNPANPKYDAAIKLWRRLPRSVVNTIGPMISRHLG